VRRRNSWEASAWRSSRGRVVRPGGAVVGGRRGEALDGAEEAGGAGEGLRGGGGVAV